MVNLATLRVGPAQVHKSGLDTKFKPLFWELVLTRLCLLSSSSQGCYNQSLQWNNRWKRDWLRLPAYSPIIQFFVVPFHPIWYLYKPLAAPITRKMRTPNVRFFSSSNSSLRVPRSQYSMMMENWGGFSVGEESDTMKTQHYSEFLLPTDHHSLSLCRDTFGFAMSHSSASPILLPHTVCSFISWMGQIPLEFLCSSWFLAYRHSIFVWVIIWELSSSHSTVSSKRPGNVCFVHKVLMRSLAHMCGRNKDTQAQGTGMGNSDKKSESQVIA